MALERTRWDIVGLALAAGYVVGFQVGKVPSALPMLEDELGLSRVAAGLVASSFYGVGAVLGVLGGLLADRLGECALERTQILHKETARLIGLEKPLVGIQPDRIGALDSTQQPLAFLGHDREASVRGVDVQPDSFRLAEVGHRFERVDCPGTGRTGVGTDRNGIESG